LIVSAWQRFAETPPGAGVPSSARVPGAALDAVQRRRRFCRERCGGGPRTFQIRADVVGTADQDGALADEVLGAAAGGAVHRAGHGMPFANYAISCGGMIRAASTIWKVQPRLQIGEARWLRGQPGISMNGGDGGIGLAPITHIDAA
jgi:hypothetical protein